MHYFYHIDVATDQSDSEFNDVIFLVIDLNISMAIGREPSSKHYIVTNESGYHQNKLEMMALLTESAARLQIRQQKRIDKLILKIAHFNRNDSIRLGRPEGGIASLISPLKTLTGQNKITAHVSIKNDSTLLSYLYFTLHYLNELNCYPIGAPKKYFFYGPVNQIEELNTFFSYGDVTKQLIPQNIELGLFIPVFGQPSFFNWSIVHGLGKSNINYFSALQRFTDTSVGLPTNGIDTFLKQNHIRREEEEDEQISAPSGNSSSSSSSSKKNKNGLSSKNLDKRKPEDEPERPSEEIKNSRTEKETTTLFPIHIDDQEKLNQFASARGVTYLHDEKKTTNTYQLIIAPVSVIPSAKRNLGVLTQQRSIPKNTILGEYRGEKKDINQVENTEYTFELEGSSSVDASEQFNWCAIVNHAMSPHIANLTTVLKYGKIFYKSSKEIHPFSQLLIYYGDTYHFSEDESRRFLKPTDNSDESIDIIKKNESLYRSPLRTLAPEHAQALRVSPSLLFAIPTFDDQSDHQTNWDAPLLAFNPIVPESPFAQASQENITPLMYACVQNDQGLVNRLLKNGANPNIQSSIQGYTALHITITSALALGDKQTIIQTLCDYGAIFYLQDHNNQSPLHCAINSQSRDLVAFLMEKTIKNPKQKKKHQEQMMACVDNQDRDPFIYSMSLENQDICVFLADYLSNSDVELYLEGEQPNLFHDYVKKMPCNKLKDKLFQRLSELLEAETNLDKKDEFLLLLKNIHQPTRIITRKIGLFASSPETPSTKKAITDLINDFQSIIANENDTLETTIEKLNKLFSKPVFKKCANKKQCDMLVEAVGLFIDNADWLVVPYHICQSDEPRTTQKRNSAFIYLTRDPHHPGRFNYKCIDLEQKKLQGSIEFDTPTETPNLAMVLDAISQDGQDISDTLRLRKADMCLQNARKYLTQLREDYAHPLPNLEHSLTRLTDHLSLIGFNGNALTMSI